MNITLQKDCYNCIDLSYTDANGVLHIEFDICQAHLREKIDFEEEVRKAEYQRRVDSGNPWELGYG